MPYSETKKCKTCGKVIGVFNVAGYTERDCLECQKKESDKVLDTLVEEAQERGEYE